MANLISLLGCLTFLASAYGEFLVGEDTPVWIAHGRDNGRTVDYIRFPESTVKGAIDEWKAADRLESWDIKRMHLLPPPNSKNHGCGVPKKLMPKYGTIQPSNENVIHVLVVMDHPSSWPYGIQNQEEHIRKRIVYGVAFWNGVHQQLKNDLRSIYRIRIAGIVIGNNKQAMPYLRKHEKSKCLDLSNAAVEMVNHWINVASVNQDFPSNGHQVIATMTEMPSCEKSTIWDTVEQRGQHGFIYSDTNLVRGLRRLNLENLGYSLEIWKKAKFTQYEHLRPGRAIENPPLPGQLITLNEQCQAWGWDKENRFCIQSGSFQPCDGLLCRHLDSQCKPPNTKGVAYALDGSLCEMGGMCLQGDCVSNKTMTY